LWIYTSQVKQWLLSEESQPQAIVAFRLNSRFTAGSKISTPVSTEIPARRTVMKSTVLRVVVVASVLGAAVAFAQTEETKPTTATYIMKQEIEQVSNSEQSKPIIDENTKVVDIGNEDFTLGVIHRGSTRNPAPAAAGRDRSNTGAAVDTCGRKMATRPPGGTPGAITHDFQTEGYYIVSGGGTMFTDGYIVNGQHINIPANGPSCVGMAYGVNKVVVKPGDAVIIPPGVVHGWADIPDHVDYLSYRPTSKNALPAAGWVNPTITR
jgi:mannose-6-phosphate isomerase-like protein (cupin superfamily)